MIFLRSIEIERALELSRANRGPLGYPFCRFSTPPRFHTAKGSGENRNIFCKRGWTGHFGKHEVICPSGQNICRIAENPCNHGFRFVAAKMLAVIASQRVGAKAPPDDRLREAIQGHKAKAGLLRRFRLRSLSYGGQVAPRNDEGVRSGRFLEQLTADQHAADLAGAGADLVELGIA